MDIERELETLINKHKGRQIGVGEIRLDWFAEDCLKEIRRLKVEIARQSVTNEEVAEAISWAEKNIREFVKQLKDLAETKERYDYQIKKGEPWKWEWEKSWRALAVEKFQTEKKSAELAITALQAYQPWIPVSERLPENCESYLVVVREEDQPNDLIHVDVASSYGKYIDDFWDTFNDWKEGQEVHITHWKPLPKPPKGE